MSTHTWGPDAIVISPFVHISTLRVPPCLLFSAWSTCPSLHAPKLYPLLTIRPRIAVVAKTVASRGTALLTRADNSSFACFPRPVQEPPEEETSPSVAPNSRYETTAGRKNSHCNGRRRLAKQLLCIAKAKHHVVLHQLVGQNLSFFRMFCFFNYHLHTSSFEDMFCQCHTVIERGMRSHTNAPKHTPRDVHARPHADYTRIFREHTQMYSTGSEKLQSNAGRQQQQKQRQRW